MALTLAQIDRLNGFLDKLAVDVYPEAPSELHTGLTRRMFVHVNTRWPLAPGTRVLDVGLPT